MKDFNDYEINISLNIPIACNLTWHDNMTKCFLNYLGFDSNIHLVKAK